MTVPTMAAGRVSSRPTFFGAYGASGASPRPDLGEDVRWLRGAVGRPFMGKGVIRVDEREGGAVDWAGWTGHLGVQPRLQNDLEALRPQSGLFPAIAAEVGDQSDRLDGGVRAAGRRCQRRWRWGARGGDDRPGLLVGAGCETGRPGWRTCWNILWRAALTRACSGWVTPVHDMTRTDRVIRPDSPGPRMGRRPRGGPTVAVS